MHKTPVSADYSSFRESVASGDVLLAQANASGTHAAVTMSSVSRLQRILDEPLAPSSIAAHTNNFTDQHTNKDDEPEPRPAPKQPGHTNNFTDQHTNKD